MRQLIRIAVALVLVAPAAFADDMAGMSMHGGDAGASTFGAGVSVVAASFSPSQPDGMFYGGSYQGVMPSASWTMDRYSASASWSYYRMDRNGITAYGIGDLFASAGVTLLRGDSYGAGVMFGAAFPTGAIDNGIGMGNPMVMPMAFASWHAGRIELDGTAGYSRMLGEIDDTMVHVMSLVEPMNMEEISWTGGGDYTITRSVHAGARLAGGVPVGSVPGAVRVFGAGRVAWRRGGVDTGAELQAGLVGHPFDIRAVVTTGLTF